VTGRAADLLPRLLETKSEAQLWLHSKSVYLNSVAMSLSCDASFSSPREVREACRTGAFDGVTPACCPGFAQANLVVLRREHAFDFLLFCVRNPKPCPLLEVIDSGRLSKSIAPDADLATDLPRYCVWHDGELVEERTDVTELWPEDGVAFLLGCSFSFEQALANAALPVRHVEEKVNVAMYRTNVSTATAGRFSGPLVVSMRPMTPSEALRAVEVTSRFPAVHGGPVHIGDASVLGIADVSKPDYGDAVTVKEGEVCVFWACGVTPQAALVESKVWAITHAPGHMLVTDTKNDMLSLSPMVDTPKV
jgi:uncharacterized protein YcsI (UPF0317 family)